MLLRAQAAGVRSMIITGGSLKESRQAITLAREHGQHSSSPFPLNPIDTSSGMYATAGCHPTRSSEFDKFPGGPMKYLEALDSLIAQNLKGKGRVVAIGECGLGACLYHFAVLLYG